MKTRLKVGRLTRGERLFIHRRRLNNSQVQQAKEFNVSPFVYGLVERDAEVSCPAEISAGVAVRELTDAERCVLLRRRLGRGAAWVANELGCSRMWLRNMEQDKVANDRLVSYWVSRQR